MAKIFGHYLHAARENMLNLVMIVYYSRISGDFTPVSRWMRMLIDLIDGMKIGETITVI